MAEYSLGEDLLTRSHVFATDQDFTTPMAGQTRPSSGQATGIFAKVIREASLGLTLDQVRTSLHRQRFAIREVRRVPTGYKKIERGF